MPGVELPRAALRRFLATAGAGKDPQPFGRIGFAPTASLVAIGDVPHRQTPRASLSGQIMAAQPRESSTPGCWVRVLGLLLFGGALIAGEMPIGGISHVGFRVADLEKTRSFYSNVLGFQQAFEQKNAAGVVDLAVFKINDDQFLEFAPGVVESSGDPFTHAAFLSDRLEEMRKLIDQLGLHPPELRTGRDRTRNFSIKDPAGHRVEFIRYEANSLQALARGKFADDRRVSSHLHHLGLAGVERSFWVEKLGFVAVEGNMLHPPQSAKDFIEALPAGSRSYLSFDGKQDREFKDPDGIVTKVRRGSF